MDRAPIDGVSLFYDVRGDGEPVLLIHPGIFLDWFTPLLEQPALASYKLVCYPARGVAGATVFPA